VWPDCWVSVEFLHAPIPRKGSGSTTTMVGSAPTPRRLNGVVRSPPLYQRGGPKWRDNYPEGPGHPVAPNRLETFFVWPTTYRSQLEGNSFLPLQPDPNLLTALHSSPYSPPTCKRQCPP